MAVERLILVSGLMRSGTSAVAGMLHTMGVPMGVTMMMPVAPTWRLEWEDVAAAGMLSDWASGRADRPRQRSQAHALLADYLQCRIRETWEIDRARGLKTLAIGFKSPLLLLLWDRIRGLDVGVPITRILTTRDPAEAERSFELAMGPPDSEMRRIWAPVQERLKVARAAAGADLIVHYSRLVAAPYETAVELADLAGITDQRRIQAAAGTVLEPTA